jgi:hypothetical protein
MRAAITARAKKIISELEVCQTGLLQLLCAENCDLEQRAKVSMVATRAQDRSDSDNCSPLHQVGILRHVLSYVGPGHWFFLSTVSSLWRELYAGSADRRMQRRRLTYAMYIHSEDFTCVPQMTLYSSVVASPSRVRFASQNDVDCSTRGFQYIAGRHGYSSSVGGSTSAGNAGLCGNNVRCC